MPTALDLRRLMLRRDVPPDGSPARWVLVAGTGDRAFIIAAISETGSNVPQGDENSD